MKGYESNITTLAIKKQLYGTFYISKKEKASDFIEKVDEFVRRYNNNKYHFKYKSNKWKREKRFFITNIYNSVLKIHDTDSMMSWNNIWLSFYFILF